jgi:hypothetical protein
MKLLRDIYLRNRYATYASSCAAISKTDANYYHKTKLFTARKDRTIRTFYKTYSKEIISEVVLHNCTDFYIVRK